jgi:hypothetical protein
MAQAANEKFSTSRPRKGEAVTYCGKPHGTVSSIEGNLCWTEHGPFVWCFQTGLNLLHGWTSKQPDAQLDGDDWLPGARAAFLKRNGISTAKAEAA